MPKTKSGTCPKCRRRTYSEKFKQCTGCGLGLEPTLGAAHERIDLVKRSPAVRRSAPVPVVAAPDGELTAGRPCPMCRHTVTLKEELRAAGRLDEYESEKKKRQREAEQGG